MRKIKKNKVEKSRGFIWNQRPTVMKQKKGKGSYNRNSIKKEEI